MRRKKQVLQFLENNPCMINSLMRSNERKTFNGDIVRVITDDIKNQTKKKEPYKIGSKWLFKVDNLEIPVKITGYYLPNQMRIESTTTKGKFRMYACKREVSWFAGKLFPLSFVEEKEEVDADKEKSETI